MKSKYHKFYQVASIILLLSIISVFFALAGIISSDELSEDISEMHKFDRPALFCIVALIVLSIILISLKHIICLILSAVTALGVKRSLFGRHRLDKDNIRFSLLEAIYVDNNCSYFRMVHSFYTSSLHQLSSEIDCY